jgi:hypothetical protein
MGLGSAVLLFPPPLVLEYPLAAKTVFDGVAAAVAAADVRLWLDEGNRGGRNVE